MAGSVWSQACVCLKTLESMSLSPGSRRHRRRTCAAPVWPAPNKPPISSWRLARKRRMPPYDSAFFQPPAPVGSVTLRTPASGALFPDVPMLLDSGADVSLVPEAAVRQLGIVADPSQRYELLAFDGTISFA